MKISFLIPSGAHKIGGYTIAWSYLLLFLLFCMAIFSWLFFVTIPPVNGISFQCLLSAHFTIVCTASFLEIHLFISVLESTLSVSFFMWEGAVKRQKYELSHSRARSDDNL